MCSHTEAQIWSRQHHHNLDNAHDDAFLFLPPNKLMILTKQGRLVIAIFQGSLEAESLLFQYRQSRSSTSHPVPITLIHSDQGGWDLVMAVTENRFH